MSFVTHARRKGEAQRKKLRDACNYCALSKVRCHSQKPKCDRCQERGLSCLYGPSNRKGRPSPKKPGSAKSESSKSTPIRFENHEIPAWSLDPANEVYAYWNTQSWDTALSASPFVNGSWDSWAFQPRSDTSCNLPNPSPEIGMMADGSIATLDIARLPLGPPQRPTSCNETMECPTSYFPNGRSCISEAFAALFPLHEQEQPNDNTTSSGPSADLIILTARKATSALTRLTFCTCVPCMQDQSMPLLLIAIAAKILKWYRTLHIRDSQAASASTTQSILITMATLELPRATEIRVKAQMLLCEIEPLLQTCVVFEGKLNDRMTAWGGEVGAAFERYWKVGLLELKGLLERACEKGS